MRFSTVVLLFIALALSQSTYAQKRKIYLDFNLGAGIINERLPEKTTYRPVLFAPGFSVSLARKERPDRFFFYVEPQVVLAVLSGHRAPEFESGVNVGFSYRKEFSNYHIFLGIGSGPHYISVETDLQANGFIFSDNFFAGVSRVLKRDFLLNLQFRFRHISNAGLKSPNLGIDTFFGMLGISKSFGNSSSP